MSSAKQLGLLLLGGSFMSLVVTFFSLHLLHDKTNAKQSGGKGSLVRQYTFQENIFPKNNLKEQQESTNESIEENKINIYVLEENQEAVRYWFKLLDKMDKEERLGNTLVHFDAHAGLDFRNYEWRFPMSAYPKQDQVHLLLDSSDNFLMSTILTGVFSRVIWVFPNWALNDMRKDILKGAAKDNLSLRISAGLWRLKQEPNTDHIYLSNSWSTPVRMCTCLRPVDPEEDVNDPLKAPIRSYCVDIVAELPTRMLLGEYQKWLTKKTRSDDEFSQYVCEEFEWATTVDIISETQLWALGQSESLEGFEEVRRDTTVLLNIDTGYFGCWPSASLLQDVGFNESVLRTINRRVAGLFCGRPPRDETQADAIYRKVIGFILSNREMCSDLHLVTSVKKTRANRCISTILLDLNITEQQRPIAPFCPHTRDRTSGEANSTPLRYLTVLAQELIKLSDRQLQALAEVGICYRSVLATSKDDGDAFKICYTPGPMSDTETVDSAGRSSNFSTHLSTWEEITSLHDRMRVILENVVVQPNLVTFSRSVRTGCAPRSWVSAIERIVLDSLGELYGKVEDKEGTVVKYTDSLLGGPSGWHNRP